MVSTNGGVTWNARGSDGAQGNFFAPIQMDTAGNLWQAWTEGNAAYLSYSTNRAVSWHAKIQVSTGPGSPIGGSPDLRQMLFPWITVGDRGGWPSFSTERPTPATRPGSRVAPKHYGTCTRGSARTR
jgi:hypothetical protein